MKPKDMLIVGAFGSGKSSVTQELEKRIPQNERIVTYDQARWYMEQHNMNVNSMNEKEKNEMQLFTIASYIGAVKQATHAKVMAVLDSSLLEAHVYSRGVVNEHVIKMIEKHIREYTTSSIAYIIPPTIPLENDGLRHTDEEYRVYVYEQIVQLIHKYNIPHHYILSDGPARRAKEILTLHNNQ